MINIPSKTFRYIGGMLLWLSGCALACIALSVAVSMHANGLGWQSQKCNDEQVRWWTQLFPNTSPPESAVCAEGFGFEQVLFESADGEPSAALRHRAGWPWYCLEGHLTRSETGEFVSHGATMCQASDGTNLIIPMRPLLAGLLLDLAVLATPPIMLLRLAAALTKAARRKSRLCVECGYQTRGSKRCPECGLPQ